jgi:uncharacterized protein YggE
MRLLSTLLLIIGGTLSGQGVVLYPLDSFGIWRSAEYAQVPFDTAGPPSVFVSGTGEVTLPPDKVLLRFAVQGLGPSSADASAQIAQKMAAIADTLRRRGRPATR